MGVQMNRAAEPALSARSRDGRTFTLVDAELTALQPGDLVMLEAGDGGTFLGQLLEQPGAGSTAYHGLLLGQLSPGGMLKRSPRRPFTDADVTPASIQHVELLQDTSTATLPIGTWNSFGVEVPARLRAQGFGRHTFLCGQSGSGKTYALGVILEQLLLGTDLQLVVLDPNADFVQLGRPRPEAPAEVAERLKKLDIRLLSADIDVGEPLRMRFATMPRQAQAAVLRLDPLADRGEYNHLLHLLDGSAPQEIHEVVSRLGRSGPDGTSLAQRIENLGMLEWEVWAGKTPSAGEVVEAGARLTVLDLSGFASPHESLAVSLDLIEGLWSRRESRTPRLIVVDEAHNLCPAEPADPIQAALVDRMIQIAAEGRKYGLWLLLSTQRPSKIHPQVLSQCDNLVLMRMNSPGDIAELAEVFGFAPPAMLRSSPFFAQGDALVAGGFVPAPGLIRIGARLTFEGGGDVPVPVS
jgi:uncharacterized protein DUF87/ATPase family protein associated with various cellular activities (AAA)